MDAVLPTGGELVGSLALPRTIFLVSSSPLSPWPQAGDIIRFHRIEVREHEGKRFLGGRLPSRTVSRSTTLHPEEVCPAPRVASMGDRPR